MLQLCVEELYINDDEDIDGFLEPKTSIQDKRGYLADGQSFTACDRVKIRISVASTSVAVTMVTTIGILVYP